MSQSFILDSLHASYAAVLAALDTATAAKSLGTTVQSIRDCGYDANLKLVKARITDAERVGALAELAHDQEGIGVFVQQMRDIDIHQEVAFSQLGEPHPILGVVRTDYYIRPSYMVASDGAVPVARTTGTGGRNFQDAVNWEAYESIASRATTSHDTWILDDCFDAANSGYVAPTNARINYFSGVSAANPNRWRYDYPGHRGTHWGATLLGSAVTWTDLGSDVYSCTLPFTILSPINSPRGFLYRGITTGDGTTGGDYSSVMVSKASQALMEATEDTYYSANYTSGTTLFVHMPAGETPDNRIWAPKSASAAFGFNNGTSFKQFNEIYEEYVRIENYFRHWSMDGPIYKRGRNAAYGMDRKGSAARGWLLAYDLIGTSGALAGPIIDGCRLEHGILGIFVNTGLSNSAISSNWNITDFESYDIGGHVPDMAHSDGAPLTIQGGLNGWVMRGKFYMVRTGGAAQFYAFNNNDTNPAVVGEQDFTGIDIDCDDVLIQDHSTYWPQVGSNSADVGINLHGDANVVGDFTGNTIKLSGLISGFRHDIRSKWASQVEITSHTVGGLVVEKGSYANSDSTGIAVQISANVHTVTLSSSSGNYSIGDILADPATPANAHALVTRVLSTHPTIELEYRKIDEADPDPLFANTDTVANLSDTGTGTANGDASVIGRVGGNVKYSNIQFAADLDVFKGSSFSLLPLGNAADRNAPGEHIVADDDIYVGATTGKFGSTHGSQDLPAWKANSSSDNVYDPNSTNPSS